jgi:hypothetical protein
MCLGCLLGSGDFTSAMAGSGYYDKQARILDRQLLPILIKNGICRNDNDCVSKEVLFWSESSRGVYIGIYSIKDGRVLNELLNVCTKYFFDQKCQVDLEVHIYAVSKAEELKILLPWNKPKPVKIIMTGGNK